MTPEKTVYNLKSSGDSGQWKLIAREEGKDTEHPLVTTRDYIIGRSQESDIRVSNSQSSRKHAALIYKDSAWYIKDLDSKNGVIIGTKKVKLSKLHDGVSFTIVDSRLTLRFEPGKQEKNRTQAGLCSTGNRSKIIIGVTVTAGLLFVIGVLFVLWTGSEDVPPGEHPGNGEVGGNATGVQPIISSLSSLSVASGRNTEQQNSASAAGNKEQARDLYRQGLLFYDNGNLLAAIELWDKALVYDRENSLLLQKLAKATKELEYQINKHFNLAQNHLKYQRLFEAERELSIVRGLIKDPSDARYQKASNQLTQLQK